MNRFRNFKNRRAATRVAGLNQSLVTGAAVNQARGAFSKQAETFAASNGKGGFSNMKNLMALRKARVQARNAKARNAQIAAQLAQFAQKCAALRGGSAILKSRSNNAMKNNVEKSLQFAMSRVQSLQAELMKAQREVALIRQYGRMQCPKVFAQKAARNRALPVYGPAAPTNNQLRAAQAINNKRAQRRAPRNNVNGINWSGNGLPGNAAALAKLQANAQGYLKTAASRANWESGYSNNRFPNSMRPN